MVYSTPLIAQNPLTSPASRNKISRVEKATFPFFSIQIVASKNGSIDPKFFKNVEFVREFPCIDGYNRYVVGRFDTFEAANQYLSKIHSLSPNYKGAFVVNTTDYKIKTTSIINKPFTSTNSTPEKTSIKPTTTEVPSASKTLPKITTTATTGTATTTATGTATTTTATTTTTAITTSSNTNRLYVDGVFTPIVVKECDLNSIPKPANTSAALELLGVRITNICYPNTTTPDQTLLITSNDLVTSKYPITIARTYTLKNTCGNVVTKTQMISVEDLIKPVVVGEIKPVNVLGCRPIDFPADAKTVAELEKMDIAITDNCTSDDDLVVSSSDGPVLETYPKTVIRSYFIKDANGNVATTSQTLIINDTISPFFEGTLKDVNIQSCIFKNIPEPVKSIAEIEEMGISIADNCTPNDELELSSFDGTRVGNFPIKIIRTYTIKDTYGNSSSINQTFNITDNVNPTITGTIKASIVSGNSEKNAPIAVRTVSDLEALGVIVSDNCSADQYLVLTSTDEIIGKNPIIINRTYSIKDVCGNQAKTTHKITINEIKEAPKVQTIPIPVVNTAQTKKSSPYSNSSSPYLRRITHVDEATSPYFSIQIIALKDKIRDPEFFKYVQYIREFSCADGYNRYVVGRFETFEEANNYLSKLSSLSPKYKGAFVVNTANFKLTGSINATKSNNSAIITTTSKTVTTNGSKPVGTTKSQLIDGILSPIVIDGCNISSVPKPVNTSSALELLGLKINDICTPNKANANQKLQITSADQATEKSPLIITRTYTIKDACGNIASVPQSINITDKIPPTLSGTMKALVISGNTEKNAPAPVKKVSELEAMGVTITDNCTNDVNLLVSSADQIIGKNPIIINRVYTIKDASGNQVKTTQKITIAENNISPKTTAIPINSAPIVKTIPDKVVTSTHTNKITYEDKVPSKTFGKITYVDRATSPYFAIQLIALKERTNDLGFFKFVQYVRAFSCIDGYYRYVVGRFNTLEEANAYLSKIHSLSSKYKGAFVVNTANFKLKESINKTKPNSLPVNTSATQPDINTDKINRIYTGTLETLTIPGCAIKDLPAGVKSIAELEDMGIRITNKCTLDKNTVVSSSDLFPSGNCPITIKRIYLIKDVCGNMATIPQTIHIIDKTCPEIANSIQSFNLEGCLTKDVPPAVKTIEELEGLGVIVSDNCAANSSLVLRSSDAPPVGYCPVKIIRTYVVSDPCGNETSKTQEITKKDTVIPFIIGKIRTAHLLNFNEKTFPPPAKTVDQLESLGVQISDNCTSKADLIIRSKDESLMDVSPRIIARKYSVQDACGNAANKTQTFTLDDSIENINLNESTSGNQDINKINTFAVKPISVFSPNVTYTIQIMESEYPFYVTDFSEFKEVYEFYMPDKVFRYSFGAFKGTEVGEQLKKAQTIGYIGAVVVELNEYLPYKIE